MKQNITLFIGDNALGKTRYLKKIIMEERKKGNSIVTNIPKYKVHYTEDNKKWQILKTSNNERFDKLIINNRIETIYESYVTDLIKLIYAKGDVLVLDELDASLIPQDIILVSAALADVRTQWEKIYVNGYDIRLLRMFTDIDREDYIEDYTPNIYKVEDNMQIKKSRGGRYQ